MLSISTLFDGLQSSPSPHLTTLLRSAYDGDLSFTTSPRRPLIVSNFVQTLDGVVSLKIPGKSGGGDISGRNEEDVFIMGVLRACADAIIIGEDTFRNAPGHVWTGGAVFPFFADEFQRLRKHIGKLTLHPLNVVVSGKGRVDLNEALFRRQDVRSLVLTTQEGAARLKEREGDILPDFVRVLPGDTVLDPSDMVALLHAEYAIELLLHEGGPTLFSSFLKQSLVDECFLTVAPQIVGQGKTGQRPAFSGPLELMPEQAIWGTLVSAKWASQSGHLFLRYRI